VIVTKCDDCRQQVRVVYVEDTTDPRLRATTRLDVNLAPTLQGTVEITHLATSTAELRLEPAPGRLQIHAETCTGPK
jgi:hypothetical protein